MDNGRQFNCNRMKNICERYGIEAHYMSIAYLRANGQVKVINKMLMDSLKARVERHEG